MKKFSQALNSLILVVAIAFLFTQFASATVKVFNHDLAKINKKTEATLSSNDINRGEVLGVANDVVLAAVDPCANSIDGCTPGSSTTYTLTVYKAGIGSGTVTSSSTGINCGIDCSESYTSGASVTLTAVASSGFSFAGWSGGGCGISNSCTVTLNSNTTVTATFVVPGDPILTTLSATDITTTTAKLRGTVNLNGMSYITANARFYYRKTSDVSTPTSCLNVAQYGTGVAGSSVPVQNLTLSNLWGDQTVEIAIGDGNDVSIPTLSPGTNYSYCLVVYDNVMAPNWNYDDEVKNFTTTGGATSYTLTVAKNGTGSGTIKGEKIQFPPTGGLSEYFECGDTCSATFYPDAQLVLTATPDAGSTFTGWSGACTGTGACTLTMNSNKNVTATFSAAILTHGVDLTISDVAITRSSPGPTPSVGDIYLYGTVTLKNLGDQTAIINPETRDVIFGSINYPPTDTRAVQISGFSTGTGTITIESGGSKILDLVTVQNDEAFRTRTGFLATAGPLTLYFMVDAHNNVSEANETNNVYTHTLNILPASGTNASIKLISPQGGEQFSDPLSLKIQWSTYFYPSDRVYFYMLDQDATGKWSPGVKKLNGLGSSLAATGTWGPANYTVGSFAGTHKIRASNNPNEIKGMCLNPNFDPNSDCPTNVIPQIYAFDDSDMPFTVGTNTTTNINIITPNGGEQWSLGSTQTISWTLSGTWPTNTQTFVHLMKGDKEVLSICNSSSGIIGTSCTWKIPTAFEIYNPSLTNGGSDYKIKVSVLYNPNTGTPIATDLSDSTFSISNTTSSIKLITPNGGEQWKLGDSAQITWNKALPVWNRQSGNCDDDQIIQLVDLTANKSYIIDSVQPSQDTWYAWSVGGVSTGIYRSTSNGLCVANNDRVSLTAGRYAVRLSWSEFDSTGGIIRKSIDSQPFSLIVMPSTITTMKASTAGNYAFKMKWYRSVAASYMFNAKNMIDLVESADMGATSIKTSTALDPNKNYVIFNPDLNHVEKLDIDPSSSTTSVQLKTPLGGDYTVSSKTKIASLLGIYWGWCPTVIGPVDLGYYNAGEEILIGEVTNYNNDVLEPLYSNNSEFFFLEQGTDGKYQAVIDEGKHLGGWKGIGIKEGYDDGGFEVYQTSTAVANIAVPLPVAGTNQTPYCGFGTGTSSQTTTPTITTTPTTAPTVTTTPAISAEVLLQERIQKLEYQVSELERQLVETEKKLAQQIDEQLTNRVAGKILLQVEGNGEAWYVDKDTGKKFYLKDGGTAFTALQAFGLGISNENLAKIPVSTTEQVVVKDSDSDGLDDQFETAIGTDPMNKDTDNDGYLDGEEVSSGYSPLGVGRPTIDTNLVKRLEGRIILAVNKHGEAFYISNGIAYYLKDGSSAYQIMRNKSLGITNDDLRKIRVGEFE